MSWLRSSGCGQARPRTQVSWCLAWALSIFYWGVIPSNPRCHLQQTGCVCTESAVRQALGMACVYMYRDKHTHTHTHTHTPPEPLRASRPLSHKTQEMRWSRKQVQGADPQPQWVLEAPYLWFAITLGCCKGQSLACIWDLKLWHSRSSKSNEPEWANN